MMWFPTLGLMVGGWAAAFYAGCATVWGPVAAAGFSTLASVWLTGGFSSLRARAQAQAGKASCSSRMLHFLSLCELARATLSSTGAFHEDGLADTFDGFGGWYVCFAPSIKCPASSPRRLMACGSRSAPTVCAVCTRAHCISRCSKSTSNTGWRGLEPLDSRCSLRPAGGGWGKLQILRIMKVRGQRRSTCHAISRAGTSRNSSPIPPLCFPAHPPCRA